MQKNAGREKRRDTEGYMQLQGSSDVSVTVTELKLNDKLPNDAFDCPQFAPGTRIINTVGPDRNRIPENVLRAGKDAGRDPRRLATLVPLRTEAMEGFPRFFSALFLQTLLDRFHYTFSHTVR